MTTLSLDLRWNGCRRDAEGEEVSLRAISNASPSHPAVVAYLHLPLLHLGHGGGCDRGPDSHPPGHRLRCARWTRPSGIYKSLSLYLQMWLPTYTITYITVNTQFSTIRNLLILLPSFATNADFRSSV